MGEIINFQKPKYEIEYVTENEKIVGVTHTEWPFRIMRRGKRTAIVCEKTDEPFVILDRDVFNTILMCWLLIDDPEIIKESEG